jgi:hypothetical protein
MAGCVAVGGDGEAGAAAVVHPVMNARRTRVITTRMGMIVPMSFIHGRFGGAAPVCADRQEIRVNDSAPESLT